MKRTSPRTIDIVIFAVGMVFLNIFLIYVMDHFPRSLNPSISEFIIGTVGMGLFVGAMNFLWALFSLKLKLK
ncbi:hypothetical protein IPL85_05780 [Candidatus Saccharibacteria bacterium]|nr:MAG: hypothetical protein IPL85_05780 [Candidatus Saccharibacteria bacterium]